MFKNKDNEDFFRKFGYCILSIEETNFIENLDNILNSIDYNKNKEDLYVSNFENYELNKKTLYSISQIMEPILDRHFSNYNIITAHFLSKRPNSEVGLQLHQDWSTTDNNQWLSGHIWIPHQDITTENGALYVIPQSHTFFNNYCSGSLGMPKIRYNFFLKLISKPLLLKKGQILIFNLSLFHGSFPNLSEHPRNATLVHITEKSAPIYYYHLNDNNKIDILSIPQEAYLKDITLMGAGGTPSEYQHIKTIENNKIRNSNINTLSILLKYLKNKTT